MRSLRPALIAVLVAWPLLCAAEPKVCGNQPALGDFAEARCLVLRDDGVAPDEVKGDGVFTAEAQLAATELLEYKVLPSGAYGADQIQAVGDCDLQGGRTNAFNNLQVARPDVSGKALFAYDANARTAGDSLMTATPAGTTWVAVGSFQDPGFDPVRGAVALAPAAPGVLRGAFTADRPLGAGWEWKVLENKGSYMNGVRKYGADGWSVTPCDSKNVAVAEALSPGDRVELVLYTRTGRLQTLVTRGRAGDDPPAAQDLPSAADQAEAPPPSRDGGGDMLDPAALPGIRCNCRVAGGGRRDPGPAPLALALLGAALGRLVHRRWARGRH